MAAWPSNLSGWIPASIRTSWSVLEQYRAQGTTTTGTALGNATVTAGHWYKFLVSMSNTSGTSGNLAAACALYDYGTNGLTPGANLITFSTLETHTGLDIATNTTVWPALRITANAAVNAWDNFLVYQPASVPVITLKLANSVVALGQAATFTALADGPGTISYAWYSNNIPVSGVTGPVYTVASVSAGFTNLTVIAQNSNGSVTNAATINAVTEVTLNNNGAGWTVNQNGLADASITGNTFHGTDGNGNEAVTAWYDRKQGWPSMASPPASRIKMLAVRPATMRMECS